MQCTIANSCLASVAIGSTHLPWDRCSDAAFVVYQQSAESVRITQ
jgi:hypothetical protein